jgi:hypothetical protein
MFALGVRGKKDAHPALDFVVGSAGEHVFEREERAPLPP